MANPLKKLPLEAKANIKSYYSDRYTPHPMASSIRALDFKYELTSYETVRRDRNSRRVSYGYYHNPALLVTGPGIDKCFQLSDFKEPDRYVEESNWASGIVVGKVRSNS